MSECYECEVFIDKVFHAFDQELDVNHSIVIVKTFVQS
jgi:hypothetical protein